MLKMIKNVFIYSGVDKESYDLALPSINKANLAMVQVFSGMASVLTGIMCLLSMFLSSTSQNRTVYVAGFFGSLLLFVLSTVCAKKHTWIIIPLVYIAFSVFFLYGIFIGTITNPTQQTVTFMVMLVFMPVLFIDRPVRVLSAMAVYVLFFIFLCFKNKVDPVLSTDVMDAIIFGILGGASGSIINHIKVRSYVLEHKLHNASRTDELTQMNNRNSFESDLHAYPDKCKENLGCIYFDVNGLHELNNTKGHKEGDIMLQYIAGQIKEIFGRDFTYRIGGDEFVAFVADFEKTQLEFLLSKLKEYVERKNYHVAVGYECIDKSVLDMDTLIKAAEAQMYANKSQFYRENGRDRRRRRDDAK